MPGSRVDEKQKGAGSVAGRGASDLLAQGTGLRLLDRGTDPGVAGETGGLETLGPRCPPPGRTAQIREAWPPEAGTSRRAGPKGSTCL